jgi:nucleolar protein 56
VASRGFAALTLRYFGPPDPLPESLRELPVGYVERAVARFRSLGRVEGRSIGLFGFSGVGPLALLTAARTDDVGVVVGRAPSGVVYEGLDASGTPAGTSAWSIDGEPVP